MRMKIEANRKHLDRYEGTFLFDDGAVARLYGGPYSSRKDGPTLLYISYQGEDDHFDVRLRNEKADSFLVEHGPLFSGVI